MPKQLRDMRVAVLVENGFEQRELTEPLEALEAAGAGVDIVSPVEGDAVRGWERTAWADEFEVDVSLMGADPARYDGLVLPGGMINTERLRRHRRASRFVRAFFEAGKPVAAICHAPRTLIDAGVVRGRRLTAHHRLRRDLHHAGAEWVDRPVVVDGILITARDGDDLGAFCGTIIDGMRRRDPRAVSRMHASHGRMPSSGSIAWPSAVMTRV